jgi:hypothetical protein
MPVRLVLVGAALKFYIDAGTFEYNSSGEGGAILEPSRQMRDYWD